MTLEFDPNEYNNYLAAGVHTVSIVNHEFGETELKKIEFLELTFEDQQGAQHKERFFLNEKSLWRLAIVFKAVGHTAKIDLHANSVLKRALYGKPLSITLQDETYEGKTFPRMKGCGAVAQDAAPAKKEAAPAKEEAPAKKKAAPKKEEPVEDDADLPV